MTGTVAQYARGLILAIALMLVSTVALATPAHANATPILQGNNWLAGLGVNVCSPSTDANCGDQAHVGGIASNWWQCVELAQRLYKARGWYTGIFPNVSVASDIYDQASALGMTTQANGDITSLTPGDMIIHGTDNPYAPGAGHVSIVDTISGSTVNVVEQNTFNNDPTGQYSFTNKTLSRSGIGTIRGVVHDPGNTGSYGSQWQWHLSNTNGASGSFTAYTFGSYTTDHPIVGDWDGDGIMSGGIVRNVGGSWQWHLSNSNTDGPAFTSFTFGSATDNPIVGDWDGDGTMTPGITRGVNGQLEWHLKNVNDGGPAFTSFTFGASSDNPVVGDWDGNGTFTPGIVRNVNGTWQWHLKSGNDGGGAYVSFNFGAAATDLQIVGDWDGDGTYTPGIVRKVNGQQQWHLKSANDNGGAYVSFDYGLATDKPMVGDWDGNGSVTPGVNRQSS